MLSMFRLLMATTLITVGLTPSLTQAAEQTVVLQGSVSETHYRENTHPAAWAPLTSGMGQIVSQHDGRPLSEATIYIPALRYQTSSDAYGRFHLPQLPSKPTIAMVDKDGYLPSTATLDYRRASNGPLRIQLKKPGNVMIIDKQMHHLGDGSFSPASAGAQQFSRNSIGPVLERAFTVAPHVSGRAYLTIGSIIGLDTLAAQAQGQSQFHRYSTPMKVWLNGAFLGELALNGDQQNMYVPEGLLKPGKTNVLRIETGFTTPDGQYIDYDDMELMLLTLTWPDLGLPDDIQHATASP